jgi:type VI secretion system secreted protein Hcp
MSSCDMFLKVQGITGESADDKHKGEIEVVSWSWGMEGQSEGGLQASFRTRYTDLHIRKRVDRASATLMQYLSAHKVADQALLTVRKAGTTPLEYLKIELKQARIKALDLQTDGTEVIERVRLGFAVVTVTYTPQGATGGMGGGGVMFSDQVGQMGS